MFELDETQRAVEQAVRSWCEENVAPAVPAMERGELLPYDLLRRMGAELGVSEALKQLATRRLLKLQRLERITSADQKEAGGGFADDPMLTSILLKEISRISPGLGMALLATVGCGMAILASTSAPVIQRYAVPVLTFQRIGAWALTEPGAGSDAFGSMQTTARLEGDAFVLNGQKRSSAMPRTPMSS